jgi:hypothetical protein
MPLWTFATCFSGTVIRFTVEPLSGLSVVASMLRITFAALASEREVCWSTWTDVTPESTPTRGRVDQTYRASKASGAPWRSTWSSRLIDGVHDTARSSYARHGISATSPGKPAAQ